MIQSPVRKAVKLMQTRVTAPEITRVIGSGIHGLSWKAMTKVSR